MKSGLIVTVVTRGDDLEHHVPIGFHYVDQMFEEAGLHDALSADPSRNFWQTLRTFQRNLHREFGQRVRLRVLNLWSPEGLWVVFRYRVREFPCVLIAGQHYTVDASLEQLLEAVRQALTAASRL